MYNDNRLLANETIVPDVLTFSSFSRVQEFNTNIPCPRKAWQKARDIFFIRLYRMIFGMKIFFSPPRTSRVEPCLSSFFVSLSIFLSHTFIRFYFILLAFWLRVYFCSTISISVHLSRLSRNIC